MKGRVVLQSNYVYDHSYAFVRFQDLGSASATLQVAKAADVCGLLPGRSIEIAAAEQDYIQAEMNGDPTWVCLPPAARPSWWK